MQTNGPTTVDALVPVQVLRARSKRVTGWIVRCADHGDTTPVMRSKDKAIEQAQLHGNFEHQGQVRITHPRV